MTCSANSSSQLLPILLSSQDVGLNTDAVVYHSSSTSYHSDSQTKSLAFPLLHRSSRDSSHGHSLSSNHQSLRSIQVFSTSSNKHPGEERNHCLIALSTSQLYIYLCTFMCPFTDRMHNSYQVHTHTRACLALQMMTLNDINVFPSPLP